MNRYLTPAILGPIALCLFFASMLAQAQEAPGGVATDEIRMQAPTQNTDGTTINDLDYLTLHWGFAPGSYEQSQRISEVLPGDTLTEPVTVTLVGSHGDLVTVYYAGTATDTAGNTSAFSNEISRTYEIVDNTIPGNPTIEFVVPVAIRAIDPDGNPMGIREVASR